MLFCDIKKNHVNLCHKVIHCEMFFLAGKFQLFLNQLSDCDNILPFRDTRNRYEREFS